MCVHLCVCTCVRVCVCVCVYVCVRVCRGGSRIFREGGLNIEVISEAGGLGGT